MTSHKQTNLIEKECRFNVLSWCTAAACKPRNLPYIEVYVKTRRKRDIMLFGREEQRRESDFADAQIDLRLFCSHICITQVFSSLLVYGPYLYFAALQGVTKAIISQLKETETNNVMHACFKYEFKAIKSYFDRN